MRQPIQPLAPSRDGGTLSPRKWANIHRPPSFLLVGRFINLKLSNLKIQLSVDWLTARVSIAVSDHVDREGDRLIKAPTLHFMDSALLAGLI
ncbi:MAG: hypothetical protein V4514_02120 [Pseudomonadota bacterium]|uniref:hypothetical protein n=1 Tax=unclassified Phenylobacterium TaxID=2640670 RepID=UPI0012E38FD8|nr:MULTISPECIES: hypothetical protein [unclassified Phenylobacterium]MBT9470058.1 hypothetical protein [Phenylobacterium sp.]